jgi:hypothetical protein
VDCCSSGPPASRGKYQPIPDRHLILQDFAFTDAEWDSLHVPVGICFLVLRGVQPMALYPSPMGATEAFIDAATWSALAVRYPILTTMNADVEALLVNRARGAREHFIVPIDVCFSLVGLKRIAEAVLYEGYVLWPYRRSARKNQQRWTFGGVYPRSFCETTRSGDSWRVQTQCLVVGASPRVEVELRFLQVVDRRVAHVETDGSLRCVDSLVVDGERTLAWVS